ncbi:MAG TPA: PQQ-binding-like beta-propeller repeat protein [Bacteroidales bacterium]|nr:PQQ-binding-like beta-propeller repeat protein [Bacteroidales bacterium]
MKSHLRLTTLALLILAEINLFAQVSAERQWPSYRGYMSSGVLDKAGLPEKFDFSTGENIKWKINVPGLGLSSPVIWGDRLFITTAVSTADLKGISIGMGSGVMPVKDSSMHEWKVICLDKNNGKKLWEKTSYKGIPAMKRHPKSTHANSSVATDGKYVVAFFGSEGLYCYDMNGNLKWQKNYGLLKSVFFSMHNAEWEFASSPVIYNNVVIVQCDVLENSFVAAYDVSTGKELWKTNRDEYPGWCTPNIYLYQEKPYVVLNGYKNRAGFDFATGKEIWRMSGGGDIQIPTPILGKDVIYFTSGHGSVSPVMAIRNSARGDITLKNDDKSNEYVKWFNPRAGSYMHTLLLYNGLLYSLEWNGMLRCIDPETGNEVYNAKLGKADSFVASPVASDGRIFIVGEHGIVYIIGDGRTYRLLSEIPMNEISLVAPAITEGMIFFRTQGNLYCVSEKK